MSAYMLSYSIKQTRVDGKLVEPPQEPPPEEKEVGPSGAVLDFVREQEPRFKKVPDAELIKFVAKQDPKFLQDPEFKAQFTDLVDQSLPPWLRPPAPPTPRPSLSPIRPGEELTEPEPEAPPKAFELPPEAEILKRVNADDESWSPELKYALKAIQWEPPLGVQKPPLGEEDIGQILEQFQSESAAKLEKAAKPLRTPAIRFSRDRTAAEIEDLKKAPKWVQRVAGYMDTVAAFGDFLTTGEGIMTLPVLGAAGGVGIAARLGVGAHMVHGAFEATEELGKELGKPKSEQDTLKIGQLESQIALSTLMAGGLIGKEGVRGGKTAVNKLAGPPVPPVISTYASAKAGQFLERMQKTDVLEQVAPVEEFAQVGPEPAVRAAPETAKALAETAKAEVSPGLTKVGELSLVAPPKGPIIPKPAVGSPGKASGRVTPEVPETPAEAGRDVTLIQEIQQKGAHTIADIQKLFPDMELTREQARVHRDAAWPEEAAERVEAERGVVQGLINERNALERLPDKTEADLARLDQLDLQIAQARKAKNVPQRTSESTTPSEPTTVVQPVPPKPGPPTEPVVPEVPPTVSKGLPGETPTVTPEKPAALTPTERTRLEALRNEDVFGEITPEQSAELLELEKRSEIPEPTKPAEPEKTTPTTPTKPDPNWQVSVQAPMKMTNVKTGTEETVPGFVQIDDISGGANKWSKSKETLAKEGVEVPDFSSLPSGKYTFAEAEALLAKQKAGAEPEWMGEKLSYWDKLQTPKAVQKMDPAKRASLAKSLSVLNTPKSIAEKIASRVSEIKATAAKAKTTPPVEPTKPTEPVEPTEPPKEINLAREELLQSGDSAVAAMAEKYGLTDPQMRNLLHKQREAAGISAEDIPLSPEDRAELAVLRKAGDKIEPLDKIRMEALEERERAHPTPTAGTEPLGPATPTQVQAALTKVPEHIADAYRRFEAARDASDKWFAENPPPDRGPHVKDFVIADPEKLARYEAAQKRWATREEWEAASKAEQAKAEIAAKEFLDAVRSKDNDPARALLKYAEKASKPKVQRRPMTDEEVKEANKQLMAQGSKDVIGIEKEFDDTHSPRRAREYLPEVIDDALSNDPTLKKEAERLFQARHGKNPDDYATMVQSVTKDPNYIAQPGAPPIPQSGAEALNRFIFDALAEKDPTGTTKGLVERIVREVPEIEDLRRVAWRQKRENRALIFATKKLAEHGINETDAMSMLDYDGWRDARLGVWQMDPGLAMWIERNVFKKKNWQLEDDPPFGGLEEIVGAAHPLRAKVEAATEAKAATVTEPEMQAAAASPPTANPGAPPPSAPSPVPLLPIKGQRQIITDIAKGLGTPIRFGRLRTSRFAGYFLPRANLIGAQRAIDMPVVSHEAGHKLDQTFNMSSQPALAGELSMLGDPATPGSRSSWTPKKSVAYRHGEGVAEFVRYWLMDPAHARTVAPNTYAYWEQVLEANRDIADVMNQAQADIQTWRNAPAEMKLDSHISIGNNPNKTRYTFNHFFRDVINDLNFLDVAAREAEILAGRKLLPSEDPHLLARNLRGSYGMAENFILNGVARFGSKEVTPGTSLKHALAPVAGRIPAFRRWIVAKRAQELHANGKETGIAPAVANEVARLYDNDPVFKKAFDDVKIWQRALLQYAQDAGFLQPENVARMERMNQDFVPYHRIFEVGAGEAPSIEAGGTGRGLNVGKPASFRAQRGSTREIVDPLETMLRNAYAIITASEKHAINVAVAKWADMPGMGKWVEHIGTPKEHVRVGLEKIREALEDAGADLTGVPANLMLDFYRNAGVAPFGENIIRVVRDGKPQFYRLNRDLFDTFHAINIDDAGQLVKMAAYPAQMLRAGVVLDPGFALANIWRDTLGAAVINKYGILPFESTARGIAAMIGNPKLVAEWQASGGKSAVEASYFDRKKLQQFLRERVTQDLTLREQALIVAKSPLAALRFITGAAEEATRIGEYTKAYNAMVKTGMPPGEARRAAAYEARDRQDFSKGGAKTKVLRHLTPFWNATVQANVTLASAFKNRPMRTMLQGLAYITSIKMVEQAFNWNDEDYWSRPQWERDLFFMIPAGKDAQGHTEFVRLPTPFVPGLIFGTVPGRFMQWIKEQEKGHKTGPGTLWSEAYLDNLIPNPMPQFMKPVVETMLTGAQGYDMFRGRTIVPDSLADLPEEMQWTEQTSLSAKNLGNLLGISPMKIDHVIRTSTGGVGRQITHQIIDRAIEAVSDQKRTAKGTEPGGRFFSTPLAVQSQDIESFYETLKELKKETAREKAGGTPKLPIEWLGTFEDIQRTIAEIRKRSKEEGISEEDKGQAQELILELARDIMKQYRDEEGATAREKKAQAAPPGEGAVTY